MGELGVMLVLVAVVLAFVSTMLYLRLGSLGVARARIRRLVAEVWAVFALVIAAFALAASFLGEVAREQFDRELIAVFARFGALTPGQLALVIGLLVLAVALFVHLLWSLRAEEARMLRAAPPDGGEDERT